MDDSKIEDITEDFGGDAEILDLVPRLQNANKSHLMSKSVAKKKN